jgi:hypothetical protein
LNRRIVISAGTISSVTLRVLAKAVGRIPFLGE